MKILSLGLQILVLTSYLSACSQTEVDDERYFLEQSCDLFYCNEIEDKARRAALSKKKVPVQNKILEDCNASPIMRPLRALLSTRSTSQGIAQKQEKVIHYLTDDGVNLIFVRERYSDEPRENIYLMSESLSKISALLRCGLNVAEVQPLFYAITANGDDGDPPALRCVLRLDDLSVWFHLCAGSSQEGETRYLLAVKTWVYPYDSPREYGDLWRVSPHSEAVKYWMGEATP